MPRWAYYTSPRRCEHMCDVSRGEWCNKTHAHACPEGTTSQVGSHSDEHCYCLPGYNGTIKCDERSNATHRPCNVGHVFNVNSTSCDVCAPGYWCNGEHEHVCDKGMSSPVASSELNNCTCYPGSSRDECTAIVYFEVTLALTMQEFDHSAQITYTTTVANSLFVPIASVYIESITPSTAGRHLLASTIGVVTHIMVRRDVAPAVKTNATSERVLGALTDANIPATHMSKVEIMYITESAESNNIAMIIHRVFICNRHRWY